MSAVVRTAAPARPDEASRLALRAALIALPPRRRAVLVLRYWDDLPIEQVADLLGCPIGTVKSLGARGIQALRRRSAPTSSRDATPRVSCRVPGSSSRGARRW
jgi:DNA-directed RNA polymerase specialized sigma24 family protein